jgi:GNAT superfamily N-acetyltransferase
VNVTEISIDPESYAGPVVRRLVAALGEELAGRYPDDDPDCKGGEPDPEKFEPPRGRFLVAWMNGEPVGCGGVCAGDGDGPAEVRRMYVVPEMRGRGISRRILTALEQETRGLGRERLRLETGINQPEAIGLYESSGFERIPNFGPYVGEARSVCLEKRLD